MHNNEIYILLDYFNIICTIIKIKFYKSPFEKFEAPCTYHTKYTAPCIHHMKFEAHCTYHTKYTVHSTLYTSYEI